jgi:uncharacterized membrane protein YdbT with pleckstrin-like domain
MSMPRGIARSVVAVAFGVAALTATTATGAQASADVEFSAVVVDDSSSTLARTKEERTKEERTKEERTKEERTKEE